MYRGEGLAGSYESWRQRGRRLLGAATVAGALTASACSGMNSENGQVTRSPELESAPAIPATIASTAETTSSLTIPPELTSPAEAPPVTTPLPFETFKSPEPLPEGLIEDLSAKALRVHILYETSPDIFCSGMLVNNHLYTAGHCLRNMYSDEPYSEVVAVPWQANLNGTGPVLRVTKVAYTSPEVPARDEADMLVPDLFIGTVEIDGREIDSLIVDQFEESWPQAGDQFGVAGFPKAAEVPVTAQMTYLGYDPRTQNAVFAANPDALSATPCLQGISGGFMYNGRNHAFVVAQGESAVKLDGTPNDEFSYSTAYYGYIFGVDLSSVTSLCFGEQITPQLNTRLVETLED